jgi:hypothetical protein
MPSLPPKKTRIDDKTGARIEMLGGTDLGDGDYTEVRGLETAELRLNATPLERRTPRDEVWMRGIVREVTPPNFKVQGIPVITSADTVFRGVSAAQFFLLLVPGRVVKVLGALANNQLVAREVEFEDVYKDEDDRHRRGGM